MSISHLVSLLFVTVKWRSCYFGSLDTSIVLVACPFANSRLIPFYEAIP